MLANRILRTGAALSLAAIRQACPAVFAVEPSPTRGPRYEYIPTIQPLEKLFEEGWGVFEATQNKTRSVGTEGFCRHSLRLRRLDSGKNKYGGALDGTLELSLSNAHDGTAAYSLQAAYYRLVCSNSMTAGKMIASHRVIHAKGRSTGEIIDVVSRIVEDDFPRMVKQIEAFKAATLTTSQTYLLADIAMGLRYGEGIKPFNALDLLKVRREVDAGFEAWAVLNRIQENVMQGGWETKSVWTGRKSSVRAVEAIVPAQRINQGLWAAAEQLVLA
jgi:hypothetical protein